MKVEGLWMESKAQYYLSEIGIESVRILDSALGRIIGS